MNVILENTELGVDFNIEIIVHFRNSVLARVFCNLYDKQKL